MDGPRKWALRVNATHPWSSRPLSGATMNDESYLPDYTPIIGSVVEKGRTCKVGVLGDSRGLVLERGQLIKSGSFM